MFSVDLRDELTDATIRTYALARVPVAGDVIGDPLNGWIMVGRVFLFDSGGVVVYATTTKTALVGPRRSV